MTNNAKIKINDRVKRTTGVMSLGVVKDLRTEVTATNQDAKEKGLLVQVLWDNGTLSFLGVEGLEVVKE